jgi:oligopeptide transport system ATP-binding protein
MTARTNAILQVTDLKKHFPIRKGVLKRTVRHVHAVNGVSFTIQPGESLGLVGESGCGKTTLGKCVVFLQRPTEGQVLFNGIDLSRIPEKELRRIRPQFQMVFQDPFSTLNPRMSVEAMLAEPLMLYEGSRPASAANGSFSFWRPWDFVRSTAAATLTNSQAGNASGLPLHGPWH